MRVLVLGFGSCDRFNNCRLSLALHTSLPMFGEVDGVQAVLEMENARTDCDLAINIVLTADEAADWGRRLSVAAARVKDGHYPDIHEKF